MAPRVSCLVVYVRLLSAWYPLLTVVEQPTGLGQLGLDGGTVFGRQPRVAELAFQPVDLVREAVLGLPDFGDMVPRCAITLSGDDLAVQLAAGSVEVLIGEVFLEPVRLGGLGRVGTWFDGFDVVVGSRVAGEVADGADGHRS